ncbi:hypothetical protein CMI42_01950 [Candidatus Pacearchaeota archaeon]|jgi:hypothetical protein|nr:hypothetical protein [Candidatus Pacearchaeota archaeon]|tara:strand:+ start:1931 stop:2458 length:528 start_codon:yes stop_codon:yes gene_type:complete
MAGNQLSPEQQKAAGIIIGIMMALAAAIIIARELFPVFIALSIITFIGLMICAVRDIFYHDQWDGTYWSLYVGIAFAVSIGGLFITYFIGYGIGGSSFGQASLDVYSAITGAEQEIAEAFQESINQIVEEGCKTLPEESCQIFRATAESAETIQEVADMAEKLGKASEVAEIVSK